MFNFLSLCMFRSLHSVYCLSVNVCCTDAIGCQHNCGYIYIYITVIVEHMFDLLWIINNVYTKDGFEEFLRNLEGC
jgi:hypothetical protein